MSLFGWDGWKIFALIDQSNLLHFLDTLYMMTCCSSLPSLFSYGLFAEKSPITTTIFQAHSKISKFDLALQALISARMH